MARQLTLEDGLTPYEKLCQKCKCNLDFGNESYARFKTNKRLLSFLCTFSISVVVFWSFLHVPGVPRFLGLHVSPPSHNYEGSHNPLLSVPRL